MGHFVVREKEKGREGGARRGEERREREIWRLHARSWDFRKSAETADRVPSKLSGTTRKSLPVETTTVCRADSLRRATANDERCFGVFPPCDGGEIARKDLINRSFALNNNLNAVHCKKYVLIYMTNNITQLIAKMIWKFANFRY